MTERERSRLVEDNLSLVYKILKKSCYVAAVNCSLYFDYDDLLQEGYIALMHAAETYDERSSVKFTSYAWRVIDHSLTDYLRMYNRRVQGFGGSLLSLNEVAAEDERLTLEGLIPYEESFDGDMNLSNIENAVRVIAKDGSDLSLYADIFLKMMIEGYSYEELCEDYGISIQKAYKGKERLMARIRRKKDLFDRLCGACID